MVRKMVASLSTSARNSEHLEKSPSRYLVYNLHKRGGDSADKYFKSTEIITGGKDMRSLALMLNVLHWLGTRVDKMVSMSDMNDAIVKSGILEAILIVPFRPSHSTRFPLRDRCKDCCGLFLKHNFLAPFSLESISGLGKQ